MSASSSFVILIAALPAMRLLAPASGDEAQKPWDLHAPAPIADGRPHELEGWRDISCVRCHEAIAHEWASTTHAMAWIDASFQEQLADMKRPESCYSCHIPEPLHGATADDKLPSKPKPRSTQPLAGEERALDAHFGVSCITCHVANDTILGPFGAPTEAHKSKKSVLFTDEGRSELCIACHASSAGPVIGIAKDFVDSDQASKKKSCVGCHMQAVERVIAATPNAEGAKPPMPSPVRTGRSHALQTPRDPTFLARAFAFRAGARNGTVIVTVSNECGHRVPGLVGRKITFEAELVDSLGKSVAQGDLVLDTKSPLAVEGALEIALSGSGTRVKLIGRHDSPGFDAAATFLDRTIDVEK